jgi:hypothetical protein
MYASFRNPKEIKCPGCGSETERLIGKINIGWDRKMFNTFVRGEDERGEAMEKDHMGPTPYDLMSEEQQD